MGKKQKTSRTIKRIKPEVFDDKTEMENLRKKLYFLSRPNASSYPFQSVRETAIDFNTQAPLPPPQTSSKTAPDINTQTQSPKQTSKSSPTQSLMEQRISENNPLLDSSPEKIKIISSEKNKPSPSSIKNQESPIYKLSPSSEKSPEETPKK